MLSGPCFPSGSRDAPCGSPPSPRLSPLGGWTLGQCASTSRNTLCVRLPPCGAVTHSCYSTSWANGEVPPRRTAGRVRLAVLLPPLHGVTLVGGTRGGVIWALSGAAWALEVLHTPDHTSTGFPLPRGLITFRYTHYLPHSWLPHYVLFPSPCFTVLRFVLPFPHLSLSPHHFTLYLGAPFLPTPYILSSHPSIPSPLFTFL